MVIEACDITAFTLGAEPVQQSHQTFLRVLLIVPRCLQLFPKLLSNENRKSNTISPPSEGAQTRNVLS